MVERWTPGLHALYWLSKSLAMRPIFFCEISGHFWRTPAQFFTHGSLADSVMTEARCGFVVSDSEMLRFLRGAELPFLLINIFGSEKLGGKMAG